MPPLDRHLRELQHRDRGGSSVPYAVHANEFVTNSDDGLITIKANGRISVQGLAVQANAAALGGRGASVSIEATDAVGFGPCSSVDAEGGTSGAARLPE